LGFRHREELRGMRQHRSADYARHHRPSSQSIDYPRYGASYLVALRLGPGNATIAPRPSRTIPTAVTAWQLP
ncbi:MAG TPA: hypothetical protein VJ349_17950, partial [Stellaceae bacterium]|nr:hypothetical protein [Stellaceae bacterium]